MVLRVELKLDLMSCAAVTYRKLQLAWGTGVEALIANEAKVQAIKVVSTQEPTADEQAKHQ